MRRSLCVEVRPGAARWRPEERKRIGKKKEEIGAREARFGGVGRVSFSRERRQAARRQKSKTAWRRRFGRGERESDKKGRIKIVADRETLVAADRRPDDARATRPGVGAQSRATRRNRNRGVAMSGGPTAALFLEEKSPAPHTHTHTRTAGARTGLVFSGRLFLLALFFWVSLALPLFVPLFIYLFIYLFGPSFLHWHGARRACRDPRL